MEEATIDWSLMPEGCISHILSLTSPRDTCALAVVSTIFRSATDSDFVWERFLPPDYGDITSRTVRPIAFLSKKDLYFQLCHPILIDGGRKSFMLDRWSGKKCHMISARELSITWGDDPRYWTWISPPGSRFEEVAELVKVCWLSITGKLTAAELSPDTTYVVYLIFKLTENCYGLDSPEQKGSITTTGQHSTKTVILKRRETRSSMPATHRPNRRILNFRGWTMNRDQAQLSSTQNEESYHSPYVVREDGWLEVDLGEFFNESASGNEEVVVRLFETSRMNWKSGLVVEGIELRPKK